MVKRGVRGRVAATAAAAGLLVAAVAAVSASGVQPTSGDVVANAPSAIVMADSTSPYQEFTSARATTIPRGQWVDVVQYRAPSGGPVTHTMSLALALKGLDGTRPTFVKVQWVRDKGSGWDSTGGAVYAVPTSGGDNPFYITHEHTIGGVAGPAKAQIYVHGSGTVTLRSWTVQAIGFPSY